MFETIVGLRHPRARKCVRLANVGTGFKVAPMNLVDHGWLGQLACYVSEVSKQKRLNSSRQQSCGNAYLCMLHARAAHGQKTLRALSARHAILLPASGTHMDMGKHMQQLMLNKSLLPFSSFGCAEKMSSAALPGKHHNQYHPQRIQAE